MRHQLVEPSITSTCLWKKLGFMLKCFLLLKKPLKILNRSSIEHFSCFLSMCSMTGSLISRKNRKLLMLLRRPTGLMKNIFWRLTVSINGSFGYFHVYIDNSDEWAIYWTNRSSNHFYPRNMWKNIEKSIPVDNRPWQKIRKDHLT